MGKKHQAARRHLAQAAFFALTNGYAAGFVKGGIYQGASKAVCVPGLNCYSCPGALGSCPIGALQAVIGSRTFSLSLYVIGFLTAVGAFCGRFVCGWLCPFGLVQDLLHKIPFPKKWSRLPGDRVLRHLRWVLLLVLVVLLPLLVLDVSGQGSPWFCKLVCPSGTLFGGVPLVAVNPALRAATGALFVWKTGLLLMLLLLSVVVYRPFCRYLCPLGAIYGVFNGSSIYRYSLDRAKCTDCGACKSACALCLDPRENANDPGCIRCGACKAACPHGAIASGCFLGKRGV